MGIFNDKQGPDHVGHIKTGTVSDYLVLEDLLELDTQSMVMEITTSKPKD